jgi:hypothetical protein
MVRRSMFAALPLLAGCGPQAEDPLDCEEEPLVAIAGSLPPAAEPDYVADIDCDRPSGLTATAPESLLSWPLPGRASEMDARAVLTLDLERHGESDWERSASFTWFPPEAWVVDHVDDWWCGVELDVLDGIDDCSVRAYSGIEYSYGTWPFQEPELGPVRLTTLDWTIEIPRRDSGYGTYHGDLGATWVWDSLYEIAWEGDGAVVASESIPNALYVGRELELTKPEAGTTLSSSPLEVAWDGCSDEPLYLVLRAAEIDLLRGDVLEVLCRVEDDGEFTIPAELMAHVQPGWFGELALQRVTQRQHPIDGGVLLVEERTRIVHELGRGG